MICRDATLGLNSCIASGPPPSLQHNKFLTFSRLEDGRHDVVLQTSKNFFGPSQLSYYNDMVEIDGDVGLHAAARLPTRSRLSPRMRWHPSRTLPVAQHRPDAAGRRQ